MQGGTNLKAFNMEASKPHIIGLCDKQLNGPLPPRGLQSRNLVVMFNVTTEKHTIWQPVFPNVFIYFCIEGSNAL